MRLDLSLIREAETGFDRRYEPGTCADGGEDYRVSEPVVLRAIVHRDQDRFRLVGTVQTVLQLGCSRCLELFALPVDAAFDLRYLPAAAVGAGSTGGETEVETDDVSVTFYQDDQIDLGDLVREQFYLALPMKPLCRPECQGICPQCGANRNLDACRCETRWEDPRLAGLKTLITNRKHDDA